MNFLYWILVIPCWILDIQLISFNKIASAKQIPPLMPCPLCLSYWIFNPTSNNAEIDSVEILILHHYKLFLLRSQPTIPMPILPSSNAPGTGVCTTSPPSALLSICPSQTSGKTLLSMSIAISGRPGSVKLLSWE